ncbi:cytidyltransferase domain protein [Dictyocaulus viviparus]|uniref:choline-phosphate cytidylyltransferase n=1 Tax=Dictyocaulus viviparus TaxID=29172 RepID=A0A0D8YG37_DICVI|nr:cytidyltransferase domain protein [Dictyocaulus viviparus]
MFYSGPRYQQRQARTMLHTSHKFVPYTLTQLRNGEVPENRPIHIFSEGIYDMFHYGHINQLRQVKEAFPNVKVTVGICSDEMVLKFKGGPLVMSQDERLASVAGCKYVDNVIDHGMFYPTIELLDKLQADLIAHDNIPYLVAGSVDCFKLFKESDRFLPTQKRKIYSQIVNKKLPIRRLIHIEQHPRKYPQNLKTTIKKWKQNGFRELIALYPRMGRNSSTVV